MAILFISLKAVSNDNNETYVYLIKWNFDAVSYQNISNGYNIGKLPLIIRAIN